MQPLRQFTIYYNTVDNWQFMHVKERPSIRSYILRFLDLILGKFGLHLCTFSPASRMELREVKVDVASLLTIVSEQMIEAGRSKIKPTKIVIGYPQLNMILNMKMLDEKWFVYTIPEGVPLLAGLELVVNPLIDGVVVC